MPNPILFASMAGENDVAMDTTVRLLSQAEVASEEIKSQEHPAPSFEHGCFA